MIDRNHRVSSIFCGECAGRVVAFGISDCGSARGIGDCLDVGPLNVVAAGVVLRLARGRRNRCVARRQPRIAPVDLAIFLAKMIAQIVCHRFVYRIGLLVILRVNGIIGIILDAVKRRSVCGCATARHGASVCLSVQAQVYIVERGKACGDGRRIIRVNLFGDPLIEPLNQFYVARQLYLTALYFKCPCFHCHYSSSPKSRKSSTRGTNTVTPSVRIKNTLLFSSVTRKIGF